MIPPLLFALLVGCGADTIEAEPVASVEVAPSDWSRERRRMNVDQLAASMERISGGIGWTEEQDGETVDLFQSLAVTLGKPDYLASTEESLSPGLLFQKFLDDAALSICSELSEVDASRPADERALYIAAEPDHLPGAPEIEENMSALLLRFHGRSLPVGDPELEPWVDLFEDLYEVTGAPESSWRVICVGLYTHPDFYSF